jgi:hypothetical protein
MQTIAIIVKADETTVAAFSALPGGPVGLARGRVGRGLAGARRGSRLAVVAGASV